MKYNVVQTCQLSAERVDAWVISKLNQSARAINALSDQHSTYDTSGDMKSKTL